MQPPATEELHIETTHYKFTVHVTNRFYNNIHISKHYLVGKEAKPCMSLSFYTVESISIFSEDIVSTANLNNIESLRECIDNEITNTNMRSHSFGNEILKWIYTHLRDRYKHVKKIKLDDESYIPCNRPLDTLDLMTYSIAHYKETWYEKNYKAYLLPERVHIKYRDAVEKYSSKEFKESISWERFYMVHFQSSTEFAYRLVSDDIEKYKTMYESSVTFPDFFKALTETVAYRSVSYVNDTERHYLEYQNQDHSVVDFDILRYSDKCKFYKSWLQQFINSVIPISRRWYISIQQAGGKRTRRRAINRNSNRLS